MMEQIATLTKPNPTLPIADTPCYEPEAEIDPFHIKPCFSTNSNLGEV